ncbi:MAG: serine hydrolase domain-containing protein [Steroidobacteraceae bacterium]
MQRTLVILAVFVLVTVALATGVLAANWPFWARAWRWQLADEGWPAVLPGPTQTLRGGTMALPLHFDVDPALQAFAADTNTRILLLASTDGHGSAYLAPGYTVTSYVDGRGLATGLLAPLYGLLLAQQTELLDTPASLHFKRWRADPRGEVTARQLFWQLSGFPAGVFRPLNPASSRAQLASGPDFERATRRWKQTWPAGSHFELSPVNSQLLAMLVARQTGVRYAQLLEQQLWSQLAADDAMAMLDHPRGNIAAHCCLRATATDWLRLGLLLADSGRVGARQLLPAGFVDEMATESPVHPGYGFGYRITADPAAGLVLVLETTGRQLLIAPVARRAVLWVGTGAPPLQLYRLLSAEAASGPR